MLDSLTVAHSSGYGHGVLVGLALGWVLTLFAAFAVFSFLVASSEEPPAPSQSVNLRPQLRVVRGGRR